MRIFKRKHRDLQKQRKCKCYICGEPGHFAGECHIKKGDIHRAAVIENLDITDDYDVVSVDMDEEDRESIYSFSEGEDGQECLSEMLNDDPLEIILIITEQKAKLAKTKSAKQRTRDLQT